MSIPGVFIQVVSKEEPLYARFPTVEAILQHISHTMLPADMKDVTYHRIADTLRAWGRGWSDAHPDLGITIVLHRGEEILAPSIGTWQREGRYADDPVVVEVRGAY